MPSIPVAHSATKVCACFLSMGLFSRLIGSRDRKWSMKSRGVIEARSHFSLFKTSNSICCEGMRETGIKGQVQVCSKQTDVEINTNSDRFCLIVGIFGLRLKLEGSSKPLEILLWGPCISTMNLIHSHIWPNTLVQREINIILWWGNRI